MPRYTSKITEQWMDSDVVHQMKHGCVISTRLELLRSKVPASLEATTAGPQVSVNVRITDGMDHPDEDVEAAARAILVLYHLGPLVELHWPDGNHAIVTFEVN